MLPRMPEPFTAGVQYDDLKGEVAVDGHDGPPLHDLAKLTDMPADYFPVGLSLWRLDPAEDGMIPFEVVAVDTAKTGKSMGEIIAYAKAQAEVPVHAFRGKIAPAKFGAYFRRFDMKLLTQDLVGFKVVEHHK